MLSKRKVVKSIFYAAGGLYLLVVLCILFVRHYTWWPNLSLAEYFQLSSNFIPFQTIVTYIFDLITGEIALDIVLKNILGNLVLFLPMGLFVSVILEKYDFKYTYLGFLIILLAVEIIQALLRVGFFDVDDILLNYTGFVLGVQFIKVPRVSKVIHYFY